jgi:hypothetical protein
VSVVEVKKVLLSINNDEPQGSDNLDGVTAVDRSGLWHCGELKFYFLFKMSPTKQETKKQP